MLSLAQQRKEHFTPSCQYREKRRRRLGLNTDGDQYTPSSQLPHGAHSHVHWPHPCLWEGRFNQQAATHSESADGARWVGSQGRGGLGGLSSMHCGTESILTADSCKGEENQLRSITSPPSPALPTERLRARRSHRQPVSPRNIIRIYEAAAVIEREA